MKRRVLAVDDSSLHRSYLEAALQSAGYTPISASDGAEALELANQEPPDFVLSDLQMPEMDGYRLTQRLKQDPRLRHIPVVAVSSSIELDKLMEAGFDGRVHKPITAADVRAIIDAYLEAAELLAEVEGKVP